MQECSPRWLRTTRRHFPDPRTLTKSTNKRNQEFSLWAAAVSGHTTLGVAGLRGRHDQQQGVRTHSRSLGGQREFAVSQGSVVGASWSATPPFYPPSSSSSSSSSSRRRHRRRRHHHSSISPVHNYISGAEDATM